MRSFLPLQIAVISIASKPAGEFTLIYKGSPFCMKVMPEIAAGYLQYMKAKPKKDLSTMVLSPMPGSIKSVTASVGQMVREEERTGRCRLQVAEGQEVVVIEAMKMQNSLQAGKAGKVRA